MASFHRHFGSEHGEAEAGGHAVDKGLVLLLGQELARGPVAPGGVGDAALHDDATAEQLVVVGRQAASQFA